MKYFIAHYDAQAKHPIKKDFVEELTKVPKDFTRYYRILNYIESNLEAPLDLDHLSDIAHLSKFHFHRQCSAFFQISLRDLIKMLRFKRAAYQLAYRSEIKIIDIALSSGFESHEAFSRSFKDLFNQSPSEFRNHPDWSCWQEKYKPISKLRINAMNQRENYEVKIVDVPEIKLALIEHRGSPDLLGRTIKQFIEWRKENSPPNKSRTFNLAYDDHETCDPEAYRIDIACSYADDVPENSLGIKSKIIPAGKCAMIRHTGSDDAIRAILNFLYAQWLPNTDYEPRDFPLFFERIRFFPNVPEHEMVTDIYLPIE